jgi:hypothetical protein
MRGLPGPIPNALDESRLREGYNRIPCGDLRQELRPGLAVALGFMLLSWASGLVNLLGKVPVSNQSTGQAPMVTAWDSFPSPLLQSGLLVTVLGGDFLVNFGGGC